VADALAHVDDRDRENELLWVNSVDGGGPSEKCAGASTCVAQCSSNDHDLTKKPSRAQSKRSATRTAGLVDGEIVRHWPWPLGLNSEGPLPAGDLAAGRLPREVPRHGTWPAWRVFRNRIARNAVCALDNSRVHLAAPWEP
jgi:hypothetical protein